MPISPMSEMSEAFDELKDAKEEATGNREYILLDGRKVDALVSEVGHDEAVISGGIAEQGTFTASVAQSAVADKPERGTACLVRGKRLEVLSVSDTNGVTWEILAGDPSAGDE